MKENKTISLEFFTSVLFSKKVKQIFSDINKLKYYIINRPELQKVPKFYINRKQYQLEIWILPLEQISTNLVGYTIQIYLIVL